MIAWNRVDTVLLDMDGTLLDLHFDNHFWQEYVPRRYAEHHDLDITAARAEVAARYQKVAGTLAWYCVDYWTRELDLDIERLKHETADRVALHPRVLEFLAALRANGKRAILVTNAHGKALRLKLARTGLEPHLDGIVCAHDLGHPKEQIAFWERLCERQPYDAARSVLIDDTLAVLRAARRYGIGQLVAIKRPDSRGAEREVVEFPAVNGVADLMPSQQTSTK